MGDEWKSLMDGLFLDPVTRLNVSRKKRRSDNADIVAWDDMRRGGGYRGRYRFLGKGLQLSAPSIVAYWVLVYWCPLSIQAR